MAIQEMTQSKETTSGAQKVFLLYAPQAAFVSPYLERLLGERWRVETSLSPDLKPDRAAMISSTEIYDVTEGLNYDEDTETDAEGAWHGREAMFAALCSRCGLPAVTLRCAHIVGTGMTGLPMDVARGIMRGIVAHFPQPRTPRPRWGRAPGAEAPKVEPVYLSVIHAVDVALAAYTLTGENAPGEVKSGCTTVFNLSDGANTSVDELIDAIAYRMNDKRVGTIKRRWARLLWGRRLYNALTTSLTFNSTRYTRLTSIQPNNVVTYMRTHVYDHDSL